MCVSPDSHRVLDAVETLLSWQPPPSLVAAREDYVTFLRERESAALRRDAGPAHLSASCFIFTPDLAHVLLCFHRKGQFWVQVGGHIEEGDTSIAAAALREAGEESGLHELTAVDRVLDLSTHHLSSAFGTCHTHWDVGFVALSPRVAPQVSDESEKVGWFPLTALPEPLADGVSERISLMLSQLT